MSQQIIKSHFEEAKNILAKFLSDEQNFIKIEKAGLLMLDAIKEQKKILSCGNGGSMCD
ncbi:MAG: SIS domain-containing protein, partial [Bacteroidetes bacterium]|nr:SIS domain-containing protein [Bacteroidota bacterium]